MPEKKATSKKKISVPYYTKAGVKKGTVVLPGAIFGQEPNKALLAQAVRVFLSNQRSAGAKTKRRSEVRKSKHKIYRQKGLGLARHGARSAPIFVGGGVAHGPTGLENYKLSLSKKMRQKALVSALSSKAASEAVFVADIEKVEPKTKAVFGVLKKIGGGKKSTVIHSGSQNLFRAARNIDKVDLVKTTELSAYHVLAGGNLILTKDAVDSIQERFGSAK